MNEFTLDPKLQGDSYFISDLGLSRLLLFNDSRYPWLVLVPRRDGLVEISDLNDSESQQLMREIRLCQRLLLEQFQPFKLNLGAIGNRVRQLHIHLVARRESDLAWPQPVWGHSPAVAYSENAAQQLIDKLRAAM